MKSSSSATAENPSSTSTPDVVATFASEWIAAHGGDLGLAFRSLATAFLSAEQEAEHLRQRLLSGGFLRSRQVG